MNAAGDWPGLEKENKEVKLVKRAGNQQECRGRDYVVKNSQKKSKLNLRF